MAQGGVDQDGNTLFHTAAASLAEGIRGLESISKLGIDIDQANNAGRTPLHVFCSVDWHEYLALASGLKKYFAYFLQRSKHVDAVDADGATPLHLACTASEFLVKELLAFGADASAATAEGLTALHLAARARQSNVIGMLIAALAQKHGKGGLAAHVNAKDQLGRSPLHYACRSGRPESVTLLLSVGADPGVRDGEGLTPLDACVEFEEEQALWADYRRPTAEELNEPVRGNQPTSYEVAAGIKVRDRLRPFVVEEAASNELQPVRVFPRDSILSEQDTTRLDEILEMLIDAYKEHGQGPAWILGALSRSIQRCESKGYAYTIGCLKRSEMRLKVGNETTTNKLPEGYLQAPFSKSLSLGTFERHLCRRQYGAMEALFQLDTIDPLEMGVLLRLLAKYGFADLLRKIPDHIVNDEELAGALLVACQSTLPNMEVVRVLVERFAVDVNAMSQALRQLAHGSHWWQPEQGIPYLLSKGAMLSLGVALRSPDIFAKEAVLALMNGGVDVHSVSTEDNGHSVLETAVASTQPDLEIVRRILSTGVPVTTAAVFAAVEKKAVAVLDLLLQLGADPNQRLDGVSNEGISEDWADGNGSGSPLAPVFHIHRGKSEWFALHRAAAPLHVTSEEERTQCAHMMSALLDAGADVYAVYRQPLRRPWEEADIFPGCTKNDEKKYEESPDEENDNDEWSEFDGADEYTDCDTEDVWPPRTKRYGLQSVLHGLLESGFFVEAILLQLSKQKLDIEHRNPQGRTPFLSACRSALGADASIDAFLNDLTADLHTGRYLHDPFTSRNSDNTILGSLLSLGADPLATDIYGKNALHHLLEAHDPINNNEFRAPAIQGSLRRLVTEHRQLINRPDNMGNYSLHSALQRLRRYTLLNVLRESHTEDIIVLFLTAGADPAVRDSRGNTALHYLADGLAESLRGDEQRRLFQVFLDHGVDVNARNNTGKTPLEIVLQDDGARSELRDDLCGIFVEPAQRRGEQEIDAEVFAMLDKAGARWDATDNEGQSLLHLVARYNTKRTAWRWRFLLGKGLDPLARDGRGRTAWEVAETAGFSFPEVDTVERS